MEPLLFLVHRIPFPPNKGDKIRSFNLLRHLSRRFRVHVGAFVDDAADWHHREELQDYCASLFLQPLHPLRARLRSLGALLNGLPLTVPYYRDEAMARWVAGVLEGGVARVLVFSAAMAQYLPANAADRHVVIDFVDVDSDKWAQYAGRHRFPMNWMYRREARTLLAHERRLALGARAAVFVSEEEAALFRRLAPETAARVHAIDNGVDTDYFSPHRDYPDPYPPGSLNLVFTGAMDYWANVDAVQFFAESVFPRVRLEVPDARFSVVGARPTAAVRRLGTQPGVVVTGAVRDIRPWLAHARAAVAPMRIARGVQNKVLEAFAMARPVVATSRAMEGLQADPDLPWPVSDDPDGLARCCIELLRGPAGDDLGRRARDLVCDRYSWQEHADRLADLMEGKPPPVSPSAVRLAERRA